MVKQFSDPYAQVSRVLSTEDILKKFLLKEEFEIKQGIGMVKQFTDSSIALYIGDEALLLYDAGDDRFYRLALNSVGFALILLRLESECGVDPFMVERKELVDRIADKQLSAIFQEGAKQHGSGTKN